MLAESDASLEETPVTEEAGPLAEAALTVKIQSEPELTKPAPKKPMRSAKQQEALLKARDSLTARRVAQKEEEHARLLGIQQELNNLLSENARLRAERDKPPEPPPKKKKKKPSTPPSSSDSDDGDLQIERHARKGKRPGNAPIPSVQLFRSFGF